MGDFSLYVRLDADEATPETATELIESYVDAYDNVEIEREQIDGADEFGVIVPEEALDIEHIDTYAEIYMDLRERPEVYDISLWGPGSERFPVRVYHYALQQISSPDLYDFHALDDQETLVIAESPTEMEQARRDVGPGGRPTGGGAKF